MIKMLGKMFRYYLAKETQACRVQGKYRLSVNIEPAVLRCRMIRIRVSADR